MANRPRSLVRRHAGTGLEAGSGGTLDVDLYELTEKTTPVMADSVGLVDSADDSSAKATLANIQKILGETAAGAAAATGHTEVDGVLKNDPTDEALVPATGYLFTQNAAGAPHKDAFADIVALITGNGLTDTAGVAAVLAADTSINVAAGGIKAVADESTISTAGGTIAIKANGIGLASLAATLAKGITTVPMSFETGEQAQVKIYFPYKVTINKIRGTVTKAVADTTNGTITGANTGGASANGVVTAVALDALKDRKSVV